MFTSTLTGYCRGADFIVKQTGMLAAYMMPFLAGVVAFEVFSRYFLDSPTIWAYDVSLFLFGYIAALGGAYAQQQRAHINVDILYNKVSPTTKSIFNLITYSLAIFFLLIIVDQCWYKFDEAIEFDFRRQGEWAPPMYHFWLMMIIASGLFIVQFVRDILSDVYYLATGRQLCVVKKEHLDGY